MFSELDLLLKYPFKNKEPTLIDVGANRGFFSIPFAKKGWKVVAFEPEKENLKVLKKNLFSFKKIKISNKAVSDTNEKKVDFYVSKKHFGIHALKPFHKTHELAYKVNTVRLDDFIKSYKISDVTLLKIDTEGADFLALKSFDFSKQNPEIIMVEFMDERTIKNYGYGYRDIIDYMEKRGYVSYVSEWEKVKEYGRIDVPTQGHKWIRCVLAKDIICNPDWGNIIFIRNENKQKFESVLRYYVDNVAKHRFEQKNRNFLDTTIIRKLIMKTC